MDIRVRGLKEEVVDAIKRSAEQNGRSLEAEIRVRLEESSRSRLPAFPSVSDWARAGFEDVYEAIPGFQYVASANGREFRLSLLQDLFSRRWSCEVDESIALDGRVFWERLTAGSRDFKGLDAATELRGSIQLLAEFAGLDAMNRTRSDGDAFHALPVPYRTLVGELSARIGLERELRNGAVVVWHTSEHDVYLNPTDAGHVAVIVYPKGKDWSITDGRASYFKLRARVVDEIVDHLAGLGVAVD